MAHDALRVEQLGQVLVLHLDDGKANALSASLIGAIADTVRAAEQDDGVRAVVLHGREGRFSGGFDLSVMLACDVRVGADVPAKIGLNEVAIKMVLPHWALTIAAERLSRRHLQRAIADARVTSPRDAVDVGFLDEVVPAGDLLDAAIAHAADLAATLDPPAYRATVHALRGPTLVKMDAQIEADRTAGAVPTT
jgi:enoyl-CoA hydratase